MKGHFILKGMLGIGTELLYASLILLAGLSVCLIASLI